MGLPGTKLNCLNLTGTRNNPANLIWVQVTNPEALEMWEFVQTQNHHFKFALNQIERTATVPDLDTLVNNAHDSGRTVVSENMFEMEIMKIEPQQCIWEKDSNKRDANGELLNKKRALVLGKINHA